MDDNTHAILAALVITLVHLPEVDHDVLAMCVSTRALALLMNHKTLQRVHDVELDQGPVARC